MADKIRLLPEVVANQIAAGEVVNRPASVVKEMMENAIDAGATSVKVNFRDGGKDLIQIVDDGCGMSPIDARMAFDRRGGYLRPAHVRIPRRGPGFDRRRVAGRTAHPAGRRRGGYADRDQRRAVRGAEPGDVSRGFAVLRAQPFLQRPGAPPFSGQEHHLGVADQGRVPAHRAL